MARMRESAGAERACPAGQLVRVYCGRHFSVEDIGAIGELIEQNTTLERTPLSRRICEPLQWRQPNGALKAMSCRVALLRMQAPDPSAPSQNPKNGRRPPCRSPWPAIRNRHYAGRRTSCRP